ncbi:MAG: hypothetical protein HOO99_02520 [Hyphomicrobiaceae bacterium]|nr:hypothetical protein [Hyphomicrobiaceae bacterium]
MTNLGFVRIAVTPKALHVSWRPTSITATTFAELMLRLGREHGKRVFVATLASEWGFRLCGSIADAQRHLTNAFNTLTCENEGHFGAFRRRLDGLQRHDRLELLLTGIACAGASVTAVDLWDILERHGERRFLLVKPNGDAGPLKVLAWGCGYDRFSKKLTDSLVGKSLADHPDRFYARSVSNGFWRSHAEGIPILEDVEASSWWPGRGRSTVKYTRLLIPLQISDHGPCVLSSSHTTIAS